MRAVVLAGGEGRRNRPLTYTRPKVMLPVGNHPILEHILAAAKNAGIQDVVLVVGYKAEAIQSHFQDGHGVGLRIRYVHQPKALGSADAFVRGLSQVDDDGDILLLPGDNYLGPDVLRRFLQGAGESDALLTAESTQPQQYGVVELSDEFVQSVEEKPARPKRNLISTGIAKISIPHARKAKRFSEQSAGLTDFLNELARGPPRLRAVAVEGAWFDVDRPENLLDASALHLRGVKGTVSGLVEPGASLVGAVDLGKDSRVRSGSYLVGPVVIGEGCEIGPSAVLYGPASVGDNVTIGPFTEIMDSVVMPDCRIASGCTLHHAVLDRGVILAPRVTIDRAHATDGPGFGAVVGDGTILGNNVVLRPGSVVGVNARVAPHKIVGELPDHARVV